MLAGAFKKSGEPIAILFILLSFPFSIVGSSTKLMGKASLPHVELIIKTW